MPFIGRDWRSPGEAWVKTETLGWQRMKIIETHLRPSCHQHQGLARSWPPPSEAGQHMVKNCNKIKSLSPNRTIGDQTAQNCDVSSLDGSQLSDISDCSSPTHSPERGCSCHHSVRISSPYGTHKCHDWHVSCQATNLRGTPVNSQICSCCEQAQIGRSVQMPRSLSRDSIRPSSLQNYPGIDLIRPMQHNSSFSNISNDSNTKNLDQSNEDLMKDSLIKNKDKNSLINDEKPSIDTPTILENGNRWSGPNIHENELTQEDITSDQTRVRDHIHCCCFSQHGSTDRRNLEKAVPHCRVSVRTREVAIYNTISEAFYRLDFYNAIHDIRRFNYVCKLLHLLITQNLTSLSGCATRVLFTMLEQVAWEVSSNKRNIHVIRNLLEELKQTIQKYYCWGRPIGSSALWQQHFDTIERISRIVDEISLSQTTNESQMTFDKLPIEMVREILLRLNDYRDLVNSAQASPVMSNMIDEQYIWQKLCRYHFTDQQLKIAIEDGNYLNRVKRSSLRGVKYSRTISADGRVSYRNPVVRKRVGARNSMKDDCAEPENRRADESNRGSSSNSSSDNDVSPNQFASHVVKTIRIFDKEGTSAILSRSGSSANDCTRHIRRQAFGPRTASTQEADDDSRANCLKVHPNSLRSKDVKETKRSSSDIDWELVFHQLRKKFNLKEEYADCLLLCRHCRCLFWKSIGHPCVRGEEDRTPQSRQADHESAQHEQHSVDSRNLNASTGVSFRQSVASLSRAFDPATRNLPMGSRHPRGLNVSDNFDRSILNQDRAQVNSNSDSQPINQRILREANGRNLPTSRAEKPNRDELVPKHITITPQAFLNFFSL